MQQPFLPSAEPLPEQADELRRLSVFNVSVRSFVQYWLITLHTFDDQILLSDKPLVHQESDVEQIVDNPR